MFKIADIDIGFCRISYSGKNPNNATVYYCFQDEGDDYGGVTFYRSTGDLEPSHRVDIIGPTRFETPTGDSELERRVREFMEGHPNIIMENREEMGKKDD